MIALAGLLALGAVAAPACGGGDKIVKKPKKKDAKAQSRTLIAEARDDVKAGETDAAEQAYREAYEANHTFDVLEEQVTFLIHAGRAGKAVDALFGTIKTGLKSTGRFSLPGIGALAVKQAAARESRNPRTGAKLTVPARKKVKFTEASELKSAAATFPVV